MLIQNKLIISWFKKFTPLILLFSITTALYWQILDNPLIFDSASSLNGNFFNEAMNAGLLYPRWIAHKTFLWIFQLFEMKLAQDHLPWQNAFNIFIHLLNGILAYKFYKIAFDYFIPKGTRYFSNHVIAIAGVIFFLLNPIATYATAYLIQRTILMATFFSLLCLIAVFKGFSREKAHWLILSIPLYYSAIYSKENTVIILPVILLITFLFWRDKKYFFKNNKLLIIAILSLYAIIAIIITLSLKGVLATVYEPHAKAMVALAEKGEIGVSDATAFPLSVMTQGYLFFRYLFLWIYPHLPWISIDVHLPFPKSFISWPEMPGFLLFVTLLSWLIYRLRDKNSSLLCIGLMSPMLTFFIEFTTVRLAEIFVLYRSYFWMVFLPIAIPWFILKVENHFPRFIKQWTILLFTAYMIFLTIITQNRLETFNSRLAVWEDTIKKISGNETIVLKTYRTYNNYAHALTLENQMDKAIHYYQKSVQINPSYTKAYSNLGAVFTNLGRYPEAQKAFQKALLLEPTFYDAIVGLGVSFAEQGNFENALEYYAQAIRTNPKKEDAYYNAGNAFLNLKINEKAEKMYRYAITLNPKLAEGYFNLGVMAQWAGKMEEAKNYFDQAEALKPGILKSRQNLSGQRKSTIIKTN